MPRRPDRLAWYLYPLVPVFFVLIVGAVLLSIPFGLVMAYVVQPLDERRFRRRMENRGRFVDWAELLPALEAGPGTLIVEHANKCPIRVWWTREDVLALAPCEPPGKDELQRLALGACGRHDFIAWCHRRYIAEDSGIATLTLPDEDLPGELWLSYAPYLEGRFPRISAVDTTYYFPQRGKTTAKWAGDLA